ncbi:TrlF family AAA-like ATPase [Burkholderia gladioli]|uniref:TrlF family AAA-like ATPase n=1 Tax=Burkholderia gladioli TaxID=28095 RepID=UPI00164030D2|nr:AAA family ATPase [Burkholderia gladioli]
MPNEEIGSTWKKWDLHVHTPASIVHHYPGGQDAAWEAFISDLEALPPEFKAVGINDYVFVDGYERVLRAKRVEGRLKNLDLILPVVELRLDKFGGIVQKTKDGMSESNWSRINLHVIFDEIEPAVIRDQFLSAITRHYKLTPEALGHERRWAGVVTPENLRLLGEGVIAAAPEDQKSGYADALTEGFNSLNVSLEKVQEALNTPFFERRHLLAIGKTEWDGLRWSDHTIADKRSVINEADLVFTAAESPAAYEKARKALTAAKVNDLLLDCSDAHWLSGAKDKDRIGNCFTWIKADATFAGLAQAVREFSNRVYIGDNPPKRQLVERHRTKYVSSIRVKKKPDSSLPDPWFDLDVPLSSDLVAIIGNKGSGKSALSDIIALAGDTKNRSGFSFLNEQRFRNPKGRPAQHFTASIVWRDGTESTKHLDENPSPASVERIKYLPQLYLETLCNELGEGGSSTFDSELRKIIFSHVPEEDRLGQPSMDALIDFKVAEINAARQAVVKEIAKINANILSAEDRMTAEFRAGLEKQLEAKRLELAALEAAKPVEIADPAASAEAQRESQQAADLIQQLETQAAAVDREEAALRDRKGAAVKRQAVAKRIWQAIDNHKKAHDQFLQELAPLLGELGAEIRPDQLVSLQVDLARINEIGEAAVAEIASVDKALASEEADGLVKRRETVLASIESTKTQLGERQRLFIQYREALAAWEKAKTELVGGKDKAGSICWLEAEIEGLAGLQAWHWLLRASRVEKTKQIHALIVEAVNEYSRLYEPVQSFVQSAQQMDMPLPLDFEVRIDESGFQERFFASINRQARGSFYGVEDSDKRMREALGEADFSTAEGTVAFVEKLDDFLRHDRRDDAGRPTRLADQVRRSAEPREVLDYLYGLDYLSPRYSLTFGQQEIGRLSPGERGLLLLVFYLLVDKDDIPIVIDQPEENLDNQTIYRVLVKCIKAAKERRQVIIVTHNPNLAVVCDAEQIIYAECNKTDRSFTYEAGGIENPKVLEKVIHILEGTKPAFKNRSDKYAL